MTPEELATRLRPGDRIRWSSTGLAASKTPHTVESVKCSDDLPTVTLSGPGGGSYRFEPDDEGDSLRAIGKGFRDDYNIGRLCSLTIVAGYEGEE